MARYHNPAMKQLADQQVRYAPRAVRLAQIDQAENVLLELDPAGSYAYPDLCQWVTSYRPERYPDLVLSGEEAIHDLRCFVEDLSESAEISVESMDEPVLTVQEVSKHYNVSTKTVDRWRNRGLASRRVRFGNRTRIAFLKSTVDRFVARHAQEVRRGATFSQLTEGEREEIVRRARRLARHGGCPSDVTQRLARKLGRSPETVRYTLRNYDRMYPELAVFPQMTAPLTEQQKTDIYNSFRRGVSAERLAGLYGRKKSSIYKVVSEVRAGRLLEQPIEYMYSEEFERPDAEEIILGPPPRPKKQETSAGQAPPGLPPYLASLYSVPLLTREEEAYYFRKMNYLKFKAALLRERLKISQPKARDMDQIEELIDQSLDVKNFLIRSNLRLVVSIAKRHVKPNMNFFEMISDGNMSLIRAIEKFDYTKGNKFSTYASWAIMKNFARSIPAEHNQLDRFRTGNDDVFHFSPDSRTNQFKQELVNRTQRQLIMGILDQLDERERDIIVYRYGLLEGAEPHTLEQVGHLLGVTKERVRQLEIRALKKLQQAAAEQNLDIPGV